MQVKTAAVEMGNLLKASAAEHGENIKKAHRNARCTNPELLEPYDNMAFRDLIRGVKELTGLVEGQNGG